MKTVWMIVDALLNFSRRMVQTQTWRNKRPEGECGIYCAMNKTAPHMTHMESRCEVLLRRLSVVAALKPHEKLSIRRDSLFQKHAPTPSMSFVRWYNGDTRKETVQALESTVEELTGIIRTESSRITDGHAELHPHVERWCSILRASTAGLENLCITYQDDPATVSAIEVLVERIRQHCPSSLGPSSSS
jgi:hypothetical protein